MNRFKGLRMKAIVIGFIIQLAVGMLLNALFSLLLIGIHQPAEGTTHPLYSHNGYIAIALLLGLVAVAAGSYSASKVSGEPGNRHALFLGIIIVLIGLMSVDNGKSLMPVWHQAGTLLLTIPAALLGAYAYNKRMATAAGTNNQASE
ncbi:MAG: hypothetical protein J7639_18780 [Paenibacillaceae bacterium]|nr:hypothetical protein [Paenibacillaceae bacterium]